MVDKKKNNTWKIGKIRRKNCLESVGMQWFSYWEMRGNVRWTKKNAMDDPPPPKKRARINQIKKKLLEDFDIGIKERFFSSSFISWKMCMNLFCRIPKICQLIFSQL